MSLMKPISYFMMVILVVFLIVTYLIFPYYTQHSDEFQIMDFSEMSLTDAQSELEKYGMVMIVKDSTFSPIVPENHVVSQIPKAFSYVKKGRRVYLTKSIGNKPIQVPLLLGLSQKETQIILGSLGLKLVNISYEYSQEYPKDVVMRQSIKKGDIVNIGAEIDISISLGVNFKNIALKNYLLQNINIAKKEIQKYGIQIQIIKQKSNEYLPGTIINQSIPAGSLIDENMEIIFTVVE